MYEIIVRKTEELSFCRVLNGDDSSPSSTTRRITIHRSVDGVSESIKGSKVRSLFLFNVDKLPDTFINTTVANFKLMKVLDLKDAPIDHLPKGVGNLFNLHYLSVKDTKVKIIPKSIGKLLNLEILDLKYSEVRELPVEILNLKKLRYLKVYHYNDSSDEKEEARLQGDFGSLKNLQKLSFIEADSQVLRELKKLRQLKMLGIRMIKGHGKDLCAMISNLENLEALRVAMKSKEEILDIQSLSTPPQYLQRLYLKGNMKKLPDWIFKLKNLIRIGLTLSGLTDDPIRILQALPNLLQVRLTGAYNYEHMHFKEGEFPKLQKLLLWEFSSVKLVIIENGAMPELRDLRIGPCPLLMKIPIGIEHLRNLKYLLFLGMCRQVYYMTKDEAWEKVTKHIPEIDILDDMAGSYAFFSIKDLTNLSPEVTEMFKQLEEDPSNEQPRL